MLLILLGYGLFSFKAFVSSTEFVTGYVGCERELPAETITNVIPDTPFLIFWAREDLGENFLSFILPTNATTYLADYNESKYIINVATKGLVIKNINVEDADLYTRLTPGTPDLTISFSVSLLSSDDLNAVLVITYGGLQLTPETGTLTITHGVNGHLHALASNIENAGDPELVWVDAESGNSKSAVGREAELPLESGVFFVRSRLCETEANSFTVTIIESGFAAPASEEVCGSLHIELKPEDDGSLLILQRNYLTLPGYTNSLADVTAFLSDGTELSCVGSSPSCTFTLTSDQVTQLTQSSGFTIEVTAKGNGFEFTCSLTENFTSGVSIESAASLLIAVVSVLTTTYLSIT